MADHPIEELNPGAPTEPRPAAAVILLRRGGKHTSAGLQVLLGKRTSRGAVHGRRLGLPRRRGRRRAAPTTQAHRVTALRELEEEAGVALPDPGELVPFARWITPEEVKVRYDTWFYLALAPPHCSPEPDGEEIVETRLVRARRGARAARPRRAAARLPDDPQAPGPGAVRDRRGRAGRRRARRNVEPILPARGRERRRAAHPAPRRLGLLSPDRRQAVEREAVAQLRLAREAVGLHVARAGVDHDLAALEGLRDAVLDEHAHAVERPRPPARSGPPGSRRTGKARSSRSSRCRSRATGRPRARARTRADHLGGGVGQHDRDVAVRLPSRGTYTRLR